MSDLICIVCPRGCHLHVDDNMNVTGNSCARGPKYAISELTNPTRMVASTVKVVSQIVKRLPVMTDNPIPKDKIFAVMHEINKVEIKSPIQMRQIIIENVLGLGVNVIATRELLK